jgi:hypothetical protein
MHPIRGAPACAGVALALIESASFAFGDLLLVYSDINRQSNIKALGSPLSPCGRGRSLSRVF